MVLGALLNLVDVVAIFSGVIGKQDNGSFGLVALLLGLATLAVFVYAYRLSIWDWKIRGALIALSGIIFLIAVIGMADNLRMNFGDGRDYTWSEGSRSSETIIRVVRETFAVVDVDFVLIMMLVGSGGIAAAALWGAFRWESAKTQESKDEELRSIPDAVLAKLLQDELAMGPDDGLPGSSESSVRPGPGTAYTPATVTAPETPAAVAGPQPFPDGPERPATPSVSFRALLSEEGNSVEPETQPSPDEPELPTAPSGGFRSMLLEDDKREDELRPPPRQT